MEIYHKLHIAVHDVVNIMGNNNNQFNAQLINKYRIFLKQS